jgi:hypothetical protein
MRARLRIIVSGLVGLHPIGGVAWDYLQYVLGLARLGHDVYYHEDTWSWPYHPIERRQTDDGRYSAEYIANFFANYAPQLSDRWHYLHLHETSYGMSRKAFDTVATSADLFLNVSGASLLPDTLGPQCIKIFIDTDPGYNQIVLSERFEWSENVERWCELIAEHDRFFTYAENMFGEDCTIPKLDFDWKVTRIPVVMNLWHPISVELPPRNTPWTTVMTWNVFKGPVVYRGVEYKGKGEEFKRFIDLPQRLDVTLKVAVGGVGAPRERLAVYGWQVEDGPIATLSPADYQHLIRSSRGEFSTAKHIYIALRSGWFSCRSACYLAAGRPVVVQDTGFSSVLPSGEGLFAFETVDETLAAFEAVECNYEFHSNRASEIAQEYFSAEKVLARLLSDLRV